jgi:plasmid segregation protein ParM
MGYSGPKGFHEKGNFCFPNFCIKLTGERFGEPGRNDLVYEDLDSEEKYFVGEMALRTLRGESVVTEDTLFGRNHYLHPDFLRKLRTSLALWLWELPPTDGSDLFIQTGLPPAYMSDEQYLRAALQQRHTFAVSVGAERRVFDFSITAEQVDVMYQPMGTFYSVVFDKDGNMMPVAKDYMNSNLMLFDGGFGTLDKFLVRGRQLETKDSDPRLGMLRVLEETRNLIRSDKNTGIDISIPALQGCLRSGKFKKTNMITLQQEEYDITPYLQKANEKVREEAFESIRDYVFDIQKLVMTGGTGAAWYRYFSERLKGITTLDVVPGNQNSTLPMIYSNARGYYMSRLNAMRR